jgi:hypothetical protein
MLQQVLRRLEKAFIGMWGNRTWISSVQETREDAFSVVSPARGQPYQRKSN